MRGDEARQKQKQKSRPSPRRSERKKKELKSDDDENITTPTHLQGAIQYLEKYGKTENHGDDNDFGIPTEVVQKEAISTVMNSLRREPAQR